MRFHSFGLALLDCFLSGGVGYVKAAGRHPAGATALTYPNRRITCDQAEQGQDYPQKNFFLLSKHYSLFENKKKPGSLINKDLQAF